MVSESFRRTSPGTPHASWGDATSTCQTDSEGLGNDGSGYWDSGTYAVSISNNGRYVSFSSRSTNLSPGDANAKVDVFRRDIGAPTENAVDYILGYPDYATTLGI